MYRCPSLLLVALFAITACDETLTVDNTAPKVEVTGWCTEADHLFVTVVVADFESDPVDLSLLVDGEAILAGPAGDGPRGLSSSRGTGEAHRIHWASPTDLSADAASAACALDDFSGAATCTPTPEPLPGTVQLVPVTREGGAGDPATLMGAPAPCPATPLPGPPDAARTPVDGAPSDATPRAATPPDAGAPDASAVDAMAHDGSARGHGGDRRGCERRGRQRRSRQRRAARPLHRWPRRVRRPAGRRPSAEGRRPRSPGPILRDGADEEDLGPPLDLAARDRVDRFFALRRRWARTHNLAGPRALSDPEGADLRDARALGRMLLSNLTLVDVGAGGGVPGLLLATIAPGHPVMLVEPLAKRTAFLRAAVAELKLTHVRVHRGRWPVTLAEDVQVVSRAVVSPAAWPELARAGGDRVRAVLRLLARRRPPAGLDDFVLAASFDYRVRDASRRVERWDRSPIS